MRSCPKKGSPLNTKAEKPQCPAASILLLDEDVFRADQSMNWGMGCDQAAFNAAIDSLIGSKRPATFNSPGVLLPSKAE